MFAVAILRQLAAEGPQQHKHQLASILLGSKLESTRTRTVRNSVWQHTPNPATASRTVAAEEEREIRPNVEQSTSTSDARRATAGLSRLVSPFALADEDVFE